MNQYLKTIQALLQQNNQLSEEDKQALLKTLTDADKQWSITEFKLDRTEKVKHTTAILLEETIEELEHKRKAVEEQNRELEIESSLEKVRTVAMGMRNRDDMLDICRTMSEQLELLGIKEIRNVQTAIFHKDKGTYINYEYYRLHDKALVTEVDYTKDEISIEFAAQMIKGADEVFIRSLEGQQVKDWLHFQKTTNVFIDTNLEKAKSLTYYWFSLGPVAIGTSTYDPLSEEEITLFKRFRNVFDLAYRRYLDIEKAEAQAREAQIELALERVRARTMAMQKSEELAETSLVLFQQFKDLGETSEQISIGIFKEDENIMELYSTLYGSQWKEAAKVDLDEPVVMKKIHTVWKEQKKSLVIDIAGNDLQKYNAYRKKLSNLEYREDRWVIHVAFFSKGVLTFSTTEPHPPETIQLLERFAGVFDQTYTRFLDLQKAEAQAREGQIELGLERVRARAMAMQSSNELSELVDTVFKELTKLDFALTWCIINIIDENSLTNTVWAANPDINKAPDSYHMKFEDYPFHHAMMKGYQERKTKYVYVIEGQEKKIYDEYLFTETEFKKVPEAAQAASRAMERYVVTFSFSNFGGLQTVGDTQLSESSLDILSRFGKVFDLTYTRFNDLKLAEAQAREAQIQLALERVRARTMAMQRSDELAETASLLFKQISDLGIHPWTSGFNIWEKDDSSFIGYNPTPSGGITPPYHIPSTGDNFFKKIYEAKKRGDDFLVFESAGKSLAKTYSYMKTLPVVKEVIKGIEDSGIQLPVFQINHCAFFSHGFLLFITLEAYPEVHDIFKRFAKVFEQTYIRFLDLQKAETQARESQIEAALEKVRSRSLAMHHSDELEQVVASLFDRLVELGLSFDGALIFLFDKEKRNIQLWIATVHLSVPVKIDLPRDKEIENNAIIKDLWYAIENGEHIVNRSYSGQTKNDYFRYVAKYNESKIPESVRQLQITKDWTTCFAAEKNSMVGFDSWSGHITTEADLQILIRFVRVFEQAYTRFLDLQKAEDQAREARIEAALERVRSKAMAMHTSEDLNSAVAIVFEELDKLDLGMLRCGIGVINGEKRTGEVWSTSVTEHGNTVQVSGDESMDIHPLLQGTYDAWVQQEDFSYVLHGEDLVTYYKAVEKTNIRLPELQQITAQGSRQFYYVATFQAGGLYAFRNMEFSEEAKAVMKRFANVFNLTYKRFLDLQKAEAQAREARIEAALEKVRSRSLAMHKSDELQDVVHTVFEKLKELNVDLYTAIIFIFVEGSKDFVWWLANKANQQYSRILVPYSNNPYLKNLLNAKENGKDFFSATYSFEEKNELFHHLFDHTDFKYVPEHQKRFLLESQLATMSVALAKNTGINITSYSRTSFSENENEILKRFAKVFDQAYTRFLDLQKAEAQAREGQIQLALERVRARTMAMQRSEELAETATVLFEQFNSLGEAPERIAIEIVNEKENVFEIWATQHGGSQLNLSIKLSLDEPHVMQKMYAAWKEQKKSITIDLQGDELEEYFQFLKNAGAPVKREIFGKRRVQNVATFSKGILTIITPEPRPDETIRILERFAGVFDLTYTRFLDLQKAEAQAREAQIELGLERVRARAMAMQKSDELKELIVTVSNELTKLDIILDRCFIITYDIQTMGSTWWMSNPEIPTEPIGLFVKYHEQPPYLAHINAWKERKVKWQYILEGEVKKEWDKFLFVETELSQLPDFVIANMKSKEKVYLSSSFNNFGYLTLATLEPLSEEQFDIMLRFAKVFDLTYTRFNDLKQAEAQAREAQIEAALERVRSRSMGMQKSQELKEVIQIVYEQFVHLNIHVEHTGFIMDYKERDDMHIWLADKHAVPFQVTIPYFDCAHWNSFNEAKEKGLNFFANHLSFEEKNKFYQDLFKLIPGVPEETLEYYFNCPGLAISTVLLENVGLYIENFSGIPYTDDENATLMRFGKVFQQTYTRFLDLQKAEAQAREAHIETALEKVRSRSLAMHKSDELQDVVKSLFERLDELNVELNSAIIIIFSENSKDMVWWLINRMSEQFSRVFVKYQNLTYFRDLFQARQKGLELFTKTYPADKKLELFNYLFEQTDFKNVPGERKQFILGSEYFTISTALVKNTGIQITSYSKNSFSEKDNEILRRFAKVFDQSYTRFLDLQKAEAQAREAQIEAALERVRSKAMAMHKSEDLNSAVAIVFEELDKLDMGMLRCGIGILDREKRNADVYTTTISDQGTTVQVSGDESMDIHPLLQGAFDAWLNRGDFSYVLKGEDLVNYYKAVGATNIRLPQSQTEVKEQYYYVATFEAGGLFAFRETEFPEEGKTVMKRFANVFNLTYKRFLDLQKAEAQAREAQIEGALERVRSRTMAMQRSQEIADIVGKIFGELRLLDLVLNRVLIWIFNDEERYISWWSANPEVESNAESYRVDYNEHPVFLSYLQAWQKRLPMHLYTLSGDTKRTWEDHLFTNTELSKLPMPVRKGMREEGTIFTTSTTSDYGLMMVGSFEPLSDANTDIIQRFGRVFQQSYTRYLDVQRAEAQAREAKIEAAMEKVRARAMAMQKPGELIEVAELLRKEMGMLGVEELETSSIYIHDAVSGTTECWYAIQDIREQNRKLVTDHMTIQLNDTWVGREMLKFYTSDQKQTSILMQGENRKEWINYCSQHSTLLQGYYGDVIPERTYHLLKFSNGYMGAASPGDISTESWELLKRATTVFSLAYTRFSDLQLAEANAKEAIKQSALDRIRADIASMRTIADLDKITPLIWNELTILGIPFIRCGVFIMDDSQQLIHTFLSTPDGKAIAAFHLPYNTPGNISQVLHHWRNKENYIDHWDEKIFAEFADTLVKQGALTSADQYIKTLPAGGFYLHFLPFLQGMLYVGNTNQLEKEEIRLLQSVADAFSTAYARYEDFNRLEAAKKQVDSTLNELQATQKQLIQSEKMASLGELTAGIAHEIQNPLNFVNNFSEVSNELIEEMKQELETGNWKVATEIAEDVKQNLEKILNHGKRADAIVKGMLQHSRASSGQKELTDINVLADEYVRLCYHGLRAKDKSFNATIKTDFDNTLEKINIVPQDIGRAILNLLTNAFYAVSQKKKNSLSASGEGVEYEPIVIASTKKLNDKVEIKVSDNGNGISQKALDKIFQPFFTTKPTGEGTGLGLSLAYDIVKAHGGEIKVETKEGERSEFIIMLPVV